MCIRDRVTTDLTINNLAWFGQQAIFGGLTSENVNFITMPCATKSVWSRSYHANLSYVVPNVDELVPVSYTHLMSSVDIPCVWRAAGRKRKRRRIR